MKAKKMSINILASLVAFFVQFGISFFLSPYIVSRLGEEAYGFINLSNNFVSYASLLAVAVNSMASRFISIEYNRGNIEKAKKYFSTVFWTNVFFSILVMILSMVLVYNLESVITISPNLVNQVKITFLLSFINLCISFISTVYTSATFATNKMHYNSIIQIIGNCVKSILILVLFFLLRPKIYYLTVAVLINSLVLFFGNYKVSQKLFPDFDISIRNYSFGLCKNLVKSGVWMVLSNISNLFLNGFDLLFANKLLNNALMGRLSIAKQIPLALSNLLGFFSSIFNASITETYAQGNISNMEEETKKLLKVLCFLFTVIYAGLFVFGFDFIKLWLNSSNYTISQLQEIYNLMIIVLIDIIVSTYMYSIHSIFIALNKVKVYSITLFIASLLNMGITYLLLINTNLGVYAISLTSTIVLGITHGIIIPIYAAKLLNSKWNNFLISELKSWSFLFFLVVIFVLIKCVFPTINNFVTFLWQVVICGIVGYILSFTIVLNKHERGIIIRKFILKNNNK